MKAILVSLLFVASAIVPGTAAHADDVNPGEIIGGIIGGIIRHLPHGPARPSRPGFDVCNASWSGTWYNNNARDYLRIDVNRGFNNSVRVRVQARNYGETVQGFCQYYNDGSAQLQFRGRWFDGNVNLNSRGFASGSINRFRFDGQLDGNGNGFPEPGPGPGPGPGPDLCTGDIQGNSMGRPMTLRLQPGWNGQVSVVIYAGPAPDRAQGRCVYGFDGSARLEFQSRNYWGDMTIYPDYRVIGMINRYQFMGTKR